jgi:hypothetical protein
METGYILEIKDGIDENSAMLSIPHSHLRYAISPDIRHVKLITDDNDKLKIASDFFDLYSRQMYSSTGTLSFTVIRPEEILLSYYSEFQDAHAALSHMTFDDFCSKNSDISNLLRNLRNAYTHPDKYYVYRYENNQKCLMTFASFIRNYCFGSSRTFFIGNIISFS